MLLEILKKNNPIFLKVMQDFEARYNNINIIYFYKKKDMQIENQDCLNLIFYLIIEVEKTYYIWFIDYQSTFVNKKRRIFLDMDHLGLNKYFSPHDKNFFLV